MINYVSYWLMSLGSADYVKSWENEDLKKDLKRKKALSDLFSTMNSWMTRINYCQNKFHNQVMIVFVLSPILWRNFTNIDCYSGKKIDILNSRFDKCDCKT